jgi:5-(carboxyamino)imidazole ribonucleotide synthase
MTIGILGGGQLGRMLALAGYPLGQRFRTLEPATPAPAGPLSDLLVGGYDDPALLDRFAAGLRVITYEFENVPVAAAEYLARYCPVYPPPLALAKAQDRLVEKCFFQELDIPTPPFLSVDTRADLTAAVEQLGLPAVLKTRRLGYDGKGQVVLRQTTDLDNAWAALGGVPLILEGWVAFARELSVLAVRAVTGEVRCYPLVQNHHAEGILRLSLAPAPQLTAALQAQAEHYVTRVLAALNYVGVIAIELFQMGERLLANEFAPRVHNSGHWTIEGAVTSQFANHLRAILGLPLGETTALGHSAMVNLIGTLPDLAAILAIPGSYLHLYDKTPRPGRKLGHVTLRADDADELAQRLQQIQTVIGNESTNFESR